MTYIGGRGQDILPTAHGLNGSRLNEYQIGRPAPQNHADSTRYEEPSVQPDTDIMDEYAEVQYGRVIEVLRTVQAVRNSS